MAVELCSDNNSTGISPRISFSHDLCISDNLVRVEHPLRSNSIGSLDFDFCVRKSFEQDSSSADELFSNGKILPSEIKKKSRQQNRRAEQEQISNTSNYSKKEEKAIEEAEEENKQNNSNSNSKSFWKFKRSSSLNCISGYGRSLCSLPLLSRSNSTGSATPNNPQSKDPSSSANNNNNQKNSKQALFLKQQPSISSTGYQKPPLKKNYGSYYGNGSVRVSPVLNVPSANLFGFGSIFGKDKNYKKK